MTHLRWNRALLWRWCCWWHFCGWHTSSPGEGGRAAARGLCRWTLYWRAAGRHHCWGYEETRKHCRPSRTPGWDPGRLSGRWSALSCWPLRRNCRPSSPFHKQGRIWTQGCSCPGRRASGGRREESVCRTDRTKAIEKKSFWWRQHINVCVWAFDTDRDGDARLSFLAAFVAVDPVAEGADAGGEGREGEVVVVPLPEQGHHVGELRVVDHARVRRAQDVVGHLSHLRGEENCSVFPANQRLRMLN